MFGNRLGWLLSGVMTAVFALVVWFLSTLNTVSPLSVGVVARQGKVSLNLGSHPEILDPIVLPFNPQAIMPAMTEAKDPSAVYRQAIDIYIADKKDGSFTYRDLFERGKPSTTDIKKLPALQLLIDARNYKTPNIFGSKPEDIIDYDPIVYDRVDALLNMGICAWKLALYLKDEQPALAPQLAEAAFSLGAKMCEERLRYQEFINGADLVRNSAMVLKRLAPERAAAADIDGRMQLLLKDQCVPLWTAIGSIDKSTIGRTGGDMIFIAKNAREKMWRIEAIMKLGRNRFDIGEFGKAADQRWAGITVRRMSIDETIDPIYRLAAKAAHELTHDGYLRIRT